MADVDLKKLSLEELQNMRSTIENQRAELLQAQRALSDEIKDRLAREQIAARYGAAGTMLLEFITPQQFIERREQLIAEGKIKELTPVVRTKSAETTVTVKSPSNG